MYDFKLETTSNGRPMAMAGEWSRDRSIFWPLSTFRVGHTEDEAKALAAKDADEMIAFFKARK